ncbi:MAG: GNAT family N-acetyltransferase [Bacteroidia bacterium]
MQEYQILNWDSSFFGFKVASISNKKLEAEHIKAVLQKLKDQEVKLVYWAKDPDTELPDEILKAYNGFLADRRVTFVKRLDKNLTENIRSHIGISEYPESEPDQNLLDLAVSSGRYSRFKTDPNIPGKKFRELYHLWMRNSTLRKFAKTVLVYQENEDIMGMVTLKEKNGRGAIGLIAVAAAMRGEGIGLHLLHEADKWFLKNGLEQVEVATQEENKATIFYRKLGFELDRSSHIYHFWL